MAEELIGFTIQDAIPGKIKEPVLTLEDARKYQNMDIWKIDWKTGAFKKRRTADGKIRAVSLWATMKEKEPVEWFDFEGVVPPHSEAPDIPGSTKNYPGVFLIVEKGKIEYGFSKPYMLEVFLHGEKLKGRYLFRALGKEELEKGQYIDDDKVFLLDKEDILPPSEAEDKSPSPILFLFIETVDPTPYVLSDAVKKDLLPPYGISALPKEIREKIPKELRYWEEKDRMKALEKRKQILELEILKKSEGKFTLHRRYWLDPAHKTVRYGPSQEVYDLTILDGDNLIHFSIPDKPEPLLGFLGYETGIDRKIMDIKEKKEIEPQTTLNPTKSTPCFIELIDSGNCTIFESSPEFLKVKFKGKLLDGLFVAKKEENTNIWEFETSLVPINKFVPLIKVDEFQGIVTGPVLIPNSVDTQGHIITKEEIEKAMYNFMKYSRNFSFFHNGKFINDEVFLLECAQQKGDYVLPDGRVIKDGTWYITIQETNPIRKQMIKEGKIRGFSIGGVGRMKVISWEETR